MYCLFNLQEYPYTLECIPLSQWHTILLYKHFLQVKKRNIKENVNAEKRERYTVSQICMHNV